MNKIFYVLVSKDEVGMSTCIVSDNPLFQSYHTDKNSTLYMEFYIQDEVNIIDNTQVTNYTIQYLKEHSNIQWEDLENARYEIYSCIDNVQYNNGNIINRTFEVCPMYIDSCNLNGFSTNSYDSMVYMIIKPNGQEHMVFNDDILATPEQLGEYLIDKSLIDHNCTVMINNGSDDYENLPKYPIVQGKLIVPATIEEEK
jgi:hypothetical protein